MELVFASPAALWALLGLPLLVLANWLAGRHQERVVPNLMLWRQLERELSSSRQRSRNLRRLKLLLELLLLATLTIGAAGPTLRTAAQGARRVAIVLDDSLIMQTRLAGGQTAWQAALSRGERLLDRLDPADRVALRPLLGRTATGWSSPAEARRSLAQLRVAPRLARPDPVVAGALALGEDVTVYWIGLGPPREPTHPRLVRIGVGRRDGANLGWVGFQAERPVGGRGWSITAVLASASTAPRETVVTLTSDGKPLRRRTVRVPPLDRVELRFGPDLALGRTVRLAIEGGDALEPDDRVEARLGPLVRLVVRPTGALPALDLLQRLLPELDPEAERKLHVLLGGAPPSPLPLPCVLAAPASGKGWQVAKMPPPGAFGRLADDPLLRGLDLSGVRIKQAVQVRRAPFALQPIAWSASGELPLLQRSGRLLLLSFHPGRPASNWPEDPSFPLFWRRVVRDLCPGAGSFAATVHGTRLTDNRGWHRADPPPLPASGRNRRGQRDLSFLAALLATILLLAYGALRGTRRRA